MTRLLNGYVEISAVKVAEHCKASIKYIEETQKFDDREFLNWAIPYFNRTACSNKKWQFWKPDLFDDKKEFLKWFYHKHLKKCNNWGSKDSYPKEAKAFAKVSKGFANSHIFFNHWYPSYYGDVSLKVCKRLLPEAEKMPSPKILLSLEDFKAITKWM